MILFFGASCTTPSITAIQEQQKGDFYNNRNVYDSAIMHYQNYINASSKLGSLRNFKTEADVCRKIAHAYSAQGKYNDALDYLKGALLLDSADNNTLEFIEDYRQVGLTYTYIGQYYYAAQNLQKALNLSEGMEQSLKDINRQSIAETYLVLGKVYNITGDVFKSFMCMGKARNLFEKLNNNSGLAQVYLDLANYSLDHGNLWEGKIWITESLKKLNSTDDKMLQYNALADAAEMEGKIEEAIKYHLDALEEAEKSKIIPQIIWATIRVGDAYRSINNENKAAEYYILARELNLKTDTSLLNASLDYRMNQVKAANNLFVSSGSVLGSAITYFKLGEAYFNSDKRDSALLFNTLALEKFTAANHLYGISNSRLQKANILFKKKEFNKSLTEFNSLANSHFSDILWQSQSGAGNCYRKLSQNDSALSSYKKAITTIEAMWGDFTIDEFKTKFLENKFEVYDNTISLLHETGDDEKALEFSERARARVFLDMLGNRKIPVKDSSDNELLKKEQILRLKIQKLNKSLQNSSNEIYMNNERSSRQISFNNQVENELEVLNKEYKNLIQKIKLKRREYANLLNIAPSGVKDLQEKLKPNSALISYWIGEDEALVWIIKKDDVICKKLEASPADILSSVANCREAIRRSKTIADNQLKQMYKLIFKDIVTNLQDVEDIIITPHNNLNFLPFHALIDEENQYLVENYNIQYEPSYSVFLNMEETQDPQQNRFLGMALGNITVGDFNPLPATETEVNQIATNFENKFVTIASNTTETTLKNQMNNYQILHLATHGWFNPKNPAFSYILLLPSDEDDGKLTVDEILQLNSQKKLTVLSACQTGLGELSKGDELTGLSRAFLYSGSSAVIVSLWNIDDLSSALLMNRVYYYFNKGKDLNKALSCAQRDFINGSVKDFKPPKEEIPLKRKSLGVKESPNLWAPFILIGKGNVNYK